MSDQSITADVKAAARAAAALPAPEHHASAPTLEKFVRDALNKAGSKVADLTPDQHARAVNAPKDHAGLRGKALATYIIEGLGVAEQAKAANTNATLAKAEETRRNRSEAAKASGAGERIQKVATARTSKYPANITAAVLATKEIGGRNWWPSPVDHVEARKAITDLLSEQGKEPSRANIIALAGVNEKSLKRMADMSAPREELKALKDLNSHMDDSSAKGRNLAAILLVWMDELDGKIVASSKTSSEAAQDDAPTA